MRRLSRLTVIFALVLLAFPQIALADDEDQGDRDDGGDNGDRAESMHFGPYASSSPDSGTCGNDWAQDTFKRVFTVSQDAGAWQLREDFKNGKFVTVAGASPGGCQVSTPHGSVVTAGIKGTFHGFLSGAVTGGTFTSAGGCPAPCTGDRFVAIHFGAGAIWNVVPFKFNYHADSEHLAFRRWQNASLDLGGNQGDIATH